MYWQSISELQQTKAVYQASGTRSLLGKWGTPSTTKVSKLYNVMGSVQHSHRLCRSGVYPALTTASLLWSTLNVNNEM
ncbi:hypothetical protein E5676_scaffold190G00380 [Cucumis melo var. makuwa]|uniref:Uncharacterized protein n=1 Tax=Cucumis melo var. makuwa TaxID=1194695 RepID=A0A5A7TTJ8_CUCMM|nr:hypothetical protein E6C27_scaffold1770G00010 [Cucumis melo var. makuwa]TYK25941.1 hypothetical protein E5676_scaffold190G00380 [Cucumis melo var. makuwa]